MRRIFLIDCPGVVYPSEDSETDIVLKGVVSIGSFLTILFSFGGNPESLCHSSFRRQSGVSLSSQMQKHDAEQNRLLSTQPASGGRGAVGYLVSVILQQYVVSTWDPKGSRACLCLVIIHLCGFMD